MGLPLFLILCLLAGAVYSQGTTCETCEEPYTTLFPAKYTESLEVPNPLSLNGMVAVVSGVRENQGQGEAIARMLTNEGVDVYCLSRTKHVNTTACTHIKADLTRENDVNNFVKKLTNTYGVTRVNILVLNAGRMMYAYEQDYDIESIMLPIENNFGGNYRLWDKLRRAGLLPTTGYTRIGWTSSTAAFGYLDFTNAYDFSKHLVVEHVKHQTIAARRYGYDTFTFTIAPDGVNTNISCKTFEPLVKTEVCGDFTEPIREFACPSPKYPNTPSGPTVPEDIAGFYRTIFRDPNPKYNLRIVDSMGPRDSCGGKWDRWKELYFGCNPARFAEIWNDEAIKYASPCDSPPAPK